MLLCFVSQVSFSKLEELIVKNVPKLKDKWNPRYPFGSFSNLRTLINSNLQLVWRSLNLHLIHFLVEDLKTSPTLSLKENIEKVSLLPYFSFSLLPDFLFLIILFLEIIDRYILLYKKYLSIARNIPLKCLMIKFINLFLNITSDIWYLFFEWDLNSNDGYKRVFR